MDKIHLPGREAVGLEQSCPPVANPLDAVPPPLPGALRSTITDLRDPASENKDLSTRGLEHPALAGLAGRMANTTAAGQAEVTRLSSLPSDNTIAVFYLRKPIDTVYIKIHQAGERLQVNDRPATQADTERYPKQWLAFKYSKDITNKVKEGTPLSALFQHQPTLVRQYEEAVGIHTVEQYAALSDNAIQSVHDHGLPYDPQRANEFLAQQPIKERDQNIAELSKENEALKLQLAELKSRRVRPTL